MQDHKRIALKRLKRKRKVNARKLEEKRILASGKIIMFGRGNKVIMQRNKPKAPKKVKVVKEVKPYLAVKLTAKLDKLTIQIRDANPNDPKIPSLKKRRDSIKKRLTK